MSFKWLEEAKIASWWLEWSDLEWPCAELEKRWKKRAKRFVDLGVNTVVIFGFHFRWDYIPILDRTIEVLARISEICHDEGLRFVDHHSATLIHRPRNIEDRWDIRTRNRHHVPFYPDNTDDLSFAGSKINDWRQISALTGKPEYYPGYTCEMLCPNNPEFQSAYLRLVQLHLDKIKLDGIMSDDLHFLPDQYVCTCEHCRARFREEAGLILPDASDKGFWENRENEDFQQWIQLRYQWTSEHYKRLRKILPESIALWGCACNYTGTRTSVMGHNTTLFTKYWDAVFLEIYHEFQPFNERDRIIADLAFTGSLARSQKKPLIALFYSDRPQDIPEWFKIISEAGARPWLSKMVRTESSVDEIDLLESNYGFNFPSTTVSTSPDVEVPFSFSYRDRLPIKKAEEYVEEHLRKCASLVRDGNRVTIKIINNKKHKLVN